MSIHPTDASIQPQWLNIWDKQPELTARCLVGCTEWKFALQIAMRLCVPFSYFYGFSHLSTYLLLPSIISLWYFSIVLLDVSSNDFLQKHDFDHFDLTLFKRLSCKISFSNFVYVPFARSHHKLWKTKKIVKNWFRKCPFGNWFLGNVFQDSSILVKNILGKYSFEETHSRLWL